MLRPGDAVMLVSPSGPSPRDRVERGTGILQSWGLRVVLAPNAHARTGYLAGSDADRLADLNLAFGDPDIRGIVCTRGGYGAQRIVDGIDMAAVRADPKAVVGFSDITALQLALWRGARLPSIHGPFAAWRDERTGPESAESLRRVVMSGTPAVVTARDDQETSAVLVAGRASGVLLGGNLSLLVSSIGTVDEPDLTDAILLLEDVAEAPYRVDRMLVHLHRAGLLRGVAGVAVGQFTDCTDEVPVPVADVLRERLGALGVPVLGGLPIGHGRGQLTVPVGTEATLDADAGTLTVASPFT